MEEIKINGLTVIKGDFEPEGKYRSELSNLMIEKFGAGPYSEQAKVREVITFAFKYFCGKFNEICELESAAHFYRYIMSLHEQSIEIAFLAKDSDYPEGYSKENIALYRRILKWILEKACDVPLQEEETIYEDFIKKAHWLLNELLYIGEMIFTCATVYAEQDMIEDVAEIVFDEDNQFVIGHKHHYDFVIDRIKISYGGHAFKHVVDEKPVEDLGAALKRCFGIDYGALTTVIQELHKLIVDKGGQYCGFDWESLPLSAESMFRADVNNARQIYKGLTLNRDNKLPLEELVCKPYSMNRYIHRPVLIWNIGGQDFALVGENAWRESIIELTSNKIPWGKAPEEWLLNQCFKTYMHSKEDEHDKWLDHEVEKRLMSKNLQYDRNLTSLHTSAGRLSLNIPDVGEMDFIIVDHNSRKIFVTDCKHLLGRYDMMSQKNDFANFTKSNGYNQQIANKIAFIRSHIADLDFHIRAKYATDARDITTYEIEGVFIINTPTFYMFNSDYRIYTVDIALEAMTGELQDPEFTVILDEEEQQTIFRIKYPYFRKPDYHLIDLLEIETSENE